MERLLSSQIKNILSGVVASDGYISQGRFDLFTKSKGYCEYIKQVIENLPNIRTTMYYKKDNRKDSYGGYRLFTSKHEYFVKMQNIFYKEGKKHLTDYTCSRFDINSFAHIWMCDGYLEHRKNRKKNTIQNIGWMCLESFPKEELDVFVNYMNKRLKINAGFEKVEWGFGYRVRIGGDNLQKFINSIYPYVHEDFKYKTYLYYKPDSIRCDVSLPNAEQYLKTYIDVEDIVRHSW